MKDDLVIQFAVQAVNHKFNGSILSFEKFLCVRAVLPAGELMRPGCKISMTAKADRAFESFISRQKDSGQSIYFSGTYRNKNGVDEIYLRKVVKSEPASCRFFVELKKVDDELVQDFIEFCVYEQ